jgi:N-acetylmuramoyl-L-alanine amidase
MAKVAISYGHGVNTFPDTGSKGVLLNGVRYAEHTHNAEVGSRVTKILRAHGVDVLELQPAFGQDVPLRTRTDKANAWGADLYYSIHANAGNNRGWCAFYWSTSAAGKRIAQLYAEEMSALGLPLYSGDGIYPSERGTWSDFHELRESHMVAALTENGFMTSPEDFPYIFLNKDGHWDKSAVAHAKAILRYFGIPYNAPAPVVPSQPAQRHVKIVNVNSAAIIMDKADRLNSNNIGSIPKGTVVDMIVPVTGYNNPEGYYKIVYKGTTGYINAKYGIEV